MKQSTQDTEYNFQLSDQEHSLILQDPEGSLSDAEIEAAMVQYVNGLPYIRHDATIERKPGIVECKFTLNIRIPEGTSHFTRVMLEPHMFGAAGSFFPKAFNFYRIKDNQMQRYFFPYNNWLRVEPVENATWFTPAAIKALYKPSET